MTGADLPEGEDRVSLTDSPFRTYRMADGSPIFGEYAFVTEPEGWFDDLTEPVVVLEEVWERTQHRWVTFKPAGWVDDPCDHCGESLAEHPLDDLIECVVEGHKESERRDLESRMG